MAGPYTLYFPPLYPVLKFDFLRYNKAAGPFYAGAEVPGSAGNRTAVVTNSQYPFSTASPPQAVVRVKPGPNGFGGPLPIVQLSNYSGVKQGAGGTGSSNFVFIFAGPGGTWGSLPTQNKPAGYSFATNVQTPSLMDARIAKHHPAVWAVTGTISASEPLAGAATFNIKTGMDERNAAGTSGVIQLVSSRTFTAYTVTPSPPPASTACVEAVPGDGSCDPGSATITGFIGGHAGIFKTRLQVTPEPGTLALVAVGALGLVGMRRLRDRR
jgi:hypothetical protein